ncbi:MAG TPA: response regulator [Polyangiaceae bacterium]|nr:response regulator [Polyangiaceae bacterium]
MSATVLVVDDDPVYLEVAKERLERAGFVVETRDQAIGTSEWIVEHEPDAVLLDQMMPALNGSALAQILVKRGVRTAVILHSSKSAVELAELVRTTGAVGAIPKSLDESLFLREFERLVGRSTRLRS